MEGVIMTNISPTISSYLQTENINRLVLRPKFVNENANLTNYTKKS